MHNYLFHLTYLMFLDTHDDDRRAIYLCHMRQRGTSTGAIWFTMKEHTLGCYPLTVAALGFHQDDNYKDTGHYHIALLVSRKITVGCLILLAILNISNYVHCSFTT